MNFPRVCLTLAALILTSVANHTQAAVAYSNLPPNPPFYNSTVGSTIVGDPDNDGDSGSIAMSFVPVQTWGQEAPARPALPAPGSTSANAPPALWDSGPPITAYPAELLGLLAPPAERGPITLRPSKNPTDVQKRRTAGVAWSPRRPRMKTRASDSAATKSASTSPWRDRAPRRMPATSATAAPMAGASPDLAIGPIRRRRLPGRGSRPTRRGA